MDFWEFCEPELKRGEEVVVGVGGAWKVLRCCGEGGSAVECSLWWRGDGGDVVVMMVVT